MTAPAAAKIKVGISTCLLGVNVRFGGGHKQDAYVMGTLNDFFQWVPVCPELEVGMGVPRESVRLVGPVEDPRMLTARTRIDWTDRMNRYSRDRVEALRAEHLRGYILKSKSPTCGMERVRVYGEKGMPVRQGVGLFARALMEAMPHLPIEEEGRLHDPRLRENFIVRVFSYDRWLRLAGGSFKRADLVRFHARHKFLLMAHSPRHLAELGRLVAQAGSLKPSELREAYAGRFFSALRQKATARRHQNVLLHIAGFFRDQLESGDRRELQSAIADYAAGLVPLIVPLTLIRLYARRLGLAYIEDQVYLHPHPKELMLLNHV
jgi:uncharacterized protein YbgA (DUF1722 family)/uncharacterized protein YbbK (DUF523 family)